MVTAEVAICCTLLDVVRSEPHPEIACLRVPVLHTLGIAAAWIDGRWQHHSITDADRGRPWSVDQLRAEELVKAEELLDRARRAGHGRGLEATLGKLLGAHPILAANNRGH